MTQNTPNALTISPVKQFNLVSNSLNEAVRIQSLNQMDFITKGGSKNPLQERVQEEAQAQVLELTDKLAILKASVSIQEKALDDLKSLYTSLEAGKMNDAQKTWDAWLSYIQNTLEGDNTVYTQEFAVQALPDPNDVRQYLPPNYTTQPMPNQEQLRQMLGYWYEQEDVLAILIKETQKTLNVANVTLENLQAVSPKTNPNSLLN
ncbi:MAG: hypothetical protein ACK5T0_07655 [Vampirovibrionales bacterium]|jgi:hypothetical protein